ncbi:MAG: TraK domain-containing protein [Gammaproteobacteria bacterium]
MNGVRFWLIHVLLLLSGAAAYAAGPVQTANQQLVIPEVATPVAVSNIEPNRIVCSSGNINDIAATDYVPKILDTKQGIKNMVFLTYPVVKTSAADAGNRETRPSAIDVICAGDVYTLVLNPKNVGPQVIRLGRGVKDAKKQNEDFFGEEPYVKRIFTLIEKSYMNDLPASFRVEALGNQVVNVPRELMGLRISAVRRVRPDGQGLMLTQYRVIPAVVTNPPKDVEETDFLHIAFGQRIAGIRIHPMQITARGADLYIVQRITR